MPCSIFCVHHWNSRFISMAKSWNATPGKGKALILIWWVELSTSIINSLTRFHPDFHHVGGEIKSGCDYKKSLPVVSKEGWPPFISLSYALHWKMILHISTLIIGWVDFGDFFFCRITFYSMMGHFFSDYFFPSKKRRIRFLWLWINEG